MTGADPGFQVRGGGGGAPGAPLPGSAPEWYKILFLPFEYQI
jgi:hypothetical protein